MRFQRKVLEWLKFLMGKYYLSNFLSNEAVTFCPQFTSRWLLPEFTRGRIMSHFLLPFLWLCMNLLCLIILLINMPGIWHLAFQIPISIMSWQQLQIKNPNLAGLICKVHFLFHQIDWWLDHLSDSGKNERKDDKMHCSVKNQRDWHWLLYFFCWAQY